MNRKTSHSTRSAVGPAAVAVILLGLLTHASIGEAAPASNHFQIGADGTVFDRRTGLTWQRSQAPSRMTQAQAVTYCAGLVLGTYSDFRLPAVGELFTIVDEQRLTPAIDPAVFPGTSADYPFWSSTPYAGPGGAIWRVSFDVGDAYGEDPATMLYVRCVR